ncbi:MAG: leucine-rich repeat protein [Oscillospiraceae bacterium]
MLCSIVIWYINNIKGNFLLTGRTSADPILQNTINSLYEKMNSLYYTPCKITAKGLPFLETGDLLSVTKDNQTIHTFIFSRILNGIVGMTDSYEANGVNIIREAYSTETALNQNVYKSNQTNKINYITESNGEPIILPTTGTVAVNKRFSCTAATSDFEYMSVVTAQVEEAGDIEFHYKLDDTALSSIAKQSAQSGTYQQIVLYMPFQAYDIGSHKLEVEVVSNATGKIDINHWVSCLKGQNISETENAVVSIIIIIDLPEKLCYSVNEALNLKGLKVAANYKSGDRKILDSSEYSVSADTSSVGQQNVTVSYNENSEIKDFFKIIVESSFITTWHITAGEKFVFPKIETTGHSGIIDWGDGSQPEEYKSDESINHTYTVAGNYTITIQCDEISEIISNAFASSSNITMIDMSGTKIADIGENSFYYCRYLKSVKFSENLKSIGKKSFYKSAISTVKFTGNKLESIGITAFSDCSYLRDVIDFNKNNKLTYLPAYSFENCYSLKTLTIPDSVMIIGSNCFYNCSSLENIYGIENVKRFEDSSFRYCSSLTVEIPQNTEYIGYYTFQRIKRLLNTEIISKHIDFNTFEYAALSESLYIKCTSTDYVQGYSFRYCKNLKHLIVDGNIAQDAFQEVTSLISVEIGENATAIQGFGGCKNITEITCKSSKISYVGNLNNCINILSFTIPQTATKVSCYSFSGWTVNQTIYYNGTRAALEKIISGPSTYSKYFTNCYSLIVCSDQSFYYNT